MIACWFTCGGVNEIVVSTGVLDPNLPNVQVTQMTLMCDAAPNALVLDLTGECGCSPPFWQKTPALADSSGSEQQQQPYFYVQTQQSKLGLTLCDTVSGLMSCFLVETKQCLTCDTAPSSGQSLYWLS